MLGFEQDFNEVTYEHVRSLAAEISEDEMTADAEEPTAKCQVHNSSGLDCAVSIMSFRKVMRGRVKCVCASHPNPNLLARCTPAFNQSPSDDPYLHTAREFALAVCVLGVRRCLLLKLKRHWPYCT